MLVTVSLTHYQWNPCVNDEITFSPAQLERAFLDSRQSRSVRLGLPAVNHTGDPDHADSRRNDAIEIVCDHFEDGGTKVSYSRAPAEHILSLSGARLPYSCSKALSGWRC